MGHTGNHKEFYLAQLERNLGAMLERTLVFVDTSYLLASFYNSWETGARAQLEIDLPEVVSTMGGMIENQLGTPIQRQYWYDGIPDTCLLYTSPSPRDS